MLQTLIASLLSLHLLPADANATLGPAVAPASATRNTPHMLVGEPRVQEPEAMCGLIFTCEAHGPMGKFFGDCDVATRNEMAGIAAEICAAEVE